MTTLTDTITREFSVNEIPTVFITNPVGEVAIAPGATKQITIRAIKEARSSSYEEAQRALNEIAVEATQTGDTVKIIVRLGGRPFLHANQNVRLLVTVPERTDLRGDMSAGSFQVDGITGAIETRVATGEAQFHHVTLAEQSRLHVNAGRVALDGALAPGASLDVQVHTGEAALWLPAITAAHLEAMATVGDVQVSGWPVAARRHLIGARAAGDLGGEPSGALAIKVDVGSVKLLAY